MAHVGSNGDEVALAPGRLDDEPGSVVKAHHDLQDALVTSHKLLEELLNRLQPVLNTAATESAERTPVDTPVYGSAVANWIVDQTRQVLELNAKLSLIKDLVDI